jgi:hypothetical protein
MPESEAERIERERVAADQFAQTQHTGTDQQQPPPAPSTFFVNVVVSTNSNMNNF